MTTNVIFANTDNPKLTCLYSHMKLRVVFRKLDQDQRSISDDANPGLRQSRINELWILQSRIEVFAKSFFLKRNLLSH